MTLKQITAVRVGDKYDIVVFGLTTAGDEVYALHTSPTHLNKGEWIKVPTQIKK